MSASSVCVQFADFCPPSPTALRSPISYTILTILSSNPYPTLLHNSTPITDYCFTTYPLSIPALFPTLCFDPCDFLRCQFCIARLGPLTQLVKRALTIHNPNPHPIAFKVKTTAPKQYCVRPNSGRVESGETVEVQGMSEIG